MIAYTVLAAHGWDRNTMGDAAAGLERPEPGRVRVQYDRGHEPGAAPPARVGFQGLRATAALEKVLSTIMPGLPGRPASVIASRAQSNRSAQPPRQPIKPAYTLTPILSVEQSPPWYELGGVELH